MYCLNHIEFHNSNGLDFCNKQNILGRFFISWRLQLAVFSKRDTTSAIFCNFENTILLYSFNQNHSKDNQSTYRLNDSLYLLGTLADPSYNLTTEVQFLLSNNLIIIVRFYFTAIGLITRLNVKIRFCYRVKIDGSIVRMILCSIITDPTRFFQSGSQRF